VKRAIASLVLLALLPTSVGCFGSFQLTRKIYQFNREVSSDKYVRWLIFLCLAVLPVYGGGMLIDAIFGNSVEFWGGKNPFAAGDPRTRVVFGPAGETLRATRDETGAIALDYTDAAGTARRVTLLQEGEDVLALDETGRVLARVSAREGLRVAASGTSGS
jgi:hypothetical protein